MEAKLNWNYTEISNRYKALKRKVKNNKHPNDLLKDTLANYYEILQQNDIESLYGNDEGFSLPENIENFILYLKFLDKDIKNSIQNFIKDYGYNAVYEFIKFKSFNVSQTNIADEQLIEEAYNFYTKDSIKLLGVSRILDQVFENNLIKVVRLNDTSIQAEGVTYTDFINQLGYAIINNDGTRNTIGVLNHELMHIIEIYKNPALHYQENEIFLEARAIFVEMITHYKAMQRKTNDIIRNDALNCMKNNCLLYKEQLATIELINYLSYLKKNNSAQLLIALRKQYKIDIYDECIIGDSINSCNMLYSYILALHLFEQYLIDEEKSIYLVKKSLEENPSDHYSYLKHLEFNYRDQDYIYSLYEKYNNLLEKPRIRTK